jgi:Ca2+-binding EF-hand superfamily protein
MCPPSRNRNRSPSEIKLWTEEPWKVKEAFSVMDKDGDGQISLLDLQDFFSGSRFSVGKGLSREEMEGMISVADADNSGSVDFEEFHRILRLIPPEIDEINESRSNTDDSQMWALREAFNVMDGDGDGIVSAEDLRTFFSSIASDGSSSESCNVILSDEDLADMVEAAGGSAKYGVCYEDFVRVMMTMMNGFS